VSGPTRRVVLDASAVLAWILRERGWQTVDALLPFSVVPAPAMVEVLYRAQERGHRLSPRQLHDDLVSLGIVVEPLTDADSVRAAELIGASRDARTERDPQCLSLGDGLCLAVAECLGLTVTGGDQHWASCDLSVAFLPFR
jgi:ribonuclease VapC